MTINEMRQMANLCGNLARNIEVLKTGKIAKWVIGSDEKANKLAELKTDRSDIDALNDKLQAITTLSDIEDEPSE